MRSRAAALNCVKLFLEIGAHGENRRALALQRFLFGRCPRLQRGELDVEPFAAASRGFGLLARFDEREAELRDFALPRLELGAAGRERRPQREPHRAGTGARSADERNEPGARVGGGGQINSPQATLWPATLSSAWTTST